MGEFFTSHFVIEVAGIMLAAFLAFLGGQYVIRPRRCEVQKRHCEEERRKLADCQNQKRKENRSDLFGSIGNVRSNVSEVETKFEKLIERIDHIYVRRDAVIPRLEDIHKEVQELRGLMFKLIKLNGHGDKV
jgi:hypothetical protein